jgi:hypothetical protein
MGEILAGRSDAVGAAMSTYNFTVELAWFARNNDMFRALATFHPEIS